MLANQLQPTSSGGMLSAPRLNRGRCLDDSR
jgi:hypothetical protein